MFVFLNNGPATRRCFVRPHSSRLMQQAAGALVRLDPDLHPDRRTRGDLLVRDRRAFESGSFLPEFSLTHSKNGGRHEER
jgi:hypothetical protein